jgi:hypothetical protein
LNVEECQRSTLAGSTTGWSKRHFSVGFSGSLDVPQLRLAHAGTGGELQLLEHADVVAGGE